MNLKLTTIALAAAGVLLDMMSTAQAADLTPHRAEYRVDLGLISGELNTVLERTDDGLRATHSIKPRGAIRLFTRGRIREQSTFNIDAGGVTPRIYNSDDSLSSDKVSADVIFDYELQRLIGTMTDEGTQAPVDVALPGPVYDRVSIQYQLMSDLLAGRDNDRYILYDIDEFKTLEISRIGERQIDVRAGSFEAVGIQHQAENSSRVTTLWCAPALDYLPVMIEQHRKGELKVRATLTDYSPLKP